MAKLRDVLDDTAEKPVYIQTITRRGCRFLAPVERLEAASGSGGAEAAQRGAASWWRRTAIALPIALLTGFAFRRRVSPPAQEPIHSLAVLPLENLSADPSQEYFADGMTDALITELARLNGVSVISRTSVMNFKGRHVPLPQIANSLNVDAVIEGTVMRSGDRVRITVQLIRASTDRHLRAGSYEEQLQNVIGLQDSIAQVNLLGGIFDETNTRALTGIPWLAQIPILRFEGKKLRFLRRIPVDPMTGNKDWGLRSTQDDPNTDSWGGQNVFDVYTKAQGTALDGTKYSEW